MSYMHTFIIYLNYVQNQYCRSALRFTSQYGGVAYFVTHTTFTHCCVPLGRLKVESIRITHTPTWTPSTHHHQNWDTNSVIYLGKPAQISNKTRRKLDTREQAQYLYRGARHVTHVAITRIYYVCGSKPWVLEISVIFKVCSLFVRRLKLFYSFCYIFVSTFRENITYTLCTVL